MVIMETRFIKLSNEFYSFELIKDHPDLSKYMITYIVSTIICCRYQTHLVLKICSSQLAST